MLITKIYGAAWLVLAAMTAVVFLAGTFTPAATIVLGFVASVLAGAGLLVVYPAMMAANVRVDHAVVPQARG